MDSTQVVRCAPPGRKPRCTVELTMFVLLRFSYHRNARSTVDLATEWLVLLRAFLARSVQLWMIAPWGLGHEGNTWGQLDLINGVTGPDALV